MLQVTVFCYFYDHDGYDDLSEPRTKNSRAPQTLGGVTGKSAHLSVHLLVCLLLEAWLSDMKSSDFGPIGFDTCGSGKGFRVSDLLATSSVKPRKHPNAERPKLQTFSPEAESDD